jgi:hypothetical protein
LTTNSIFNSHNIIWLGKTYTEWKNAKTTVSAVEEETIELLTGIDKIKITMKETNDTEDENDKLD